MLIWFASIFPSATMTRIILTKHDKGLNRSQCHG